MRISHWPLPKSKNGFGGFPNRVVINSRLYFTQEEYDRIKTNEIIHVIQQMECSDNPNEWTWKGYMRWLVLYIQAHFKYGYDDNPFERDSRDYDTDLKSRPRYNWKNYNAS